MGKEALRAQAKRLEELLPELNRRLFTLDPEQPVTELPLAQLRVCMVLREGPLPLSTVAERLGLSCSSVTQIADRLERAGLVARAPEPEDRRVKRLHLTDAGDEMMRARQATRVRRAEDALAHLDETDRVRLFPVLEALLSAAVHTAPDPKDRDLTGDRLAA